MDLDLQISSIDHKIKSELGKKLKSLDLTAPQMYVLQYLSEHKSDNVFQKQLVNHFHLKHPTMVGILQRLESKGLIIITTDVSNRRCKNIICTEKADMIEDEMSKHREYLEEVLTRGFCDEEIDLACDLLERMWQNLLENSVTNGEVDDNVTYKNDFERRFQKE